LRIHDETGRLAGWTWLNRGRRAQIDVDPAYRGRGVGTALLEWAEARATQLGSDWMAQTVDDKDEAGWGSPEPCSWSRAKGSTSRAGAT
jgi:mycothiol synthase